MVIGLLQPLWLWGLLGLLVPIIIHLLHKRSQRVFLVGSLQPFTGGTLVQARSLKLNETALLLLRCFLLALFVLLLAEPVWLQKDQNHKKHLFIAPALAAQTNMDSLQAAGYALYLLQPGLPAYTASTTPDTTLYNYWEVFREIESLQQTGDTVWLQFWPSLNRFWGRRPQLGKTFLNLAQPYQVKDEQFARLLSLPDQQLLLQRWQPNPLAWLVKSDTLAAADSVALKKRFGAAIYPLAPDTIKLVLQSDEADKAEVQAWQLALQLIDSLQPQQVISFRNLAVAENKLPAGTDVWIWLPDSEPPAAVVQEKGIIQILYRQGRGKQWFLQDAGNSWSYVLQHRLQAQQNNTSMLAAFIPQLQQILGMVVQQEEVPPIPLPPAQWQVQKSTTPKVAMPAITNPLDNYIWVILLFVLILERWLSLRK